MGRVHRTADDYAVEDLPRELAQVMEGARLVRVEVAEETDEPSFGKLRGIAARRRTSVEDAVARIRALRDDWD